MNHFNGSTVLVIKTDMTYTVTHQTTHILPPAGTQNALDESHKKASAQQAAPRTGVLTRSMSASALRTLWTVAKPKTPMVAVRWRERRRSVPNLSPAVPNPKVVLRAFVPNQKSTILQLGPHFGHDGSDL